MTLWQQTYSSHSVKGTETVHVMTVLGALEKPAIGRVQIWSNSGPVSARADHDLTPAQMRELARLLTVAANRIDDELEPLRERLNANAPPAALYAEPEAT